MRSSMIWDIINYMTNIEHGEYAACKNQWAWNCNQKKSESLVIESFQIISLRMEGLEPSHPREWQILSLLRLPFRHIRIYDEVYSNIINLLFQV